MACRVLEQPVTPTFPNGGLVDDVELVGGWVVEEVGVVVVVEVVEEVGDVVVEVVVVVEIWFPHTHTCSSGTSTQWDVSGGGLPVTAYATPDTPNTRRVRAATICRGFIVRGRT